MNVRFRQEIDQKREQLRLAQAELEELERQIRSFEAQLDARLGSLLDQLTELNADVHELDQILRNIRETRLFGEDLIKYLDGAPKPAHSPRLTDLPPDGLPVRKSDGVLQNDSPVKAGPTIPDIRAVYRKLARRYHPDLARNDADRLSSNEQMTEINRLFQNGDMPALLRLAGIAVPVEVEVPHAYDLPVSVRKQSSSESERLEQDMKAVRQELARLGRLPIVKLSLDVKLARHQRRDLLSEMAAELQHKIQRKIAERDYLRSQIRASGSSEAIALDQA